MNSPFDTSSMSTDLFSGKTVNIRFQYPSEDSMLAINALIAKILSRSDLKYLIDTCITVVREIILNAFKANAKRVFFTSNGYDIDDKETYTKGMKEFRKMIIDFSGMREVVIESALTIMVKFIKTGRGIVISVKNNIPMLEDEYIRASHRVRLALEHDDFNSIYREAHDSTEGAGLGLIISLLLLKNAGIDPEGFKIKKEKQYTSVEFIVPFDPRKAAAISEFKERIIREVDSLPTFPEHIMELQELCDSPRSNINTISNKILTDPSLTADVLKISNSAGFITGKRIDNISDAVIIIGLKNLKSILIATASRRILDKRYKRYEGIWDHCNRAAFYGRAIAELTGRSRISDQVFIAGLLHDIGKIALLAADDTLAGQIGQMLGTRRPGSTAILEEISTGVSHSTIGRLIAEKWHFPDFITESIAYHHMPLVAPPQFRDIITIVYLANMFCEIEKKNFDMSFIETEILEELGITERNDFDAFLNTIRKRYEIHYSSIRN